MQEHHHHDAIEDNLDTHPGRVAVYVAVGAVALVIALVMLTRLANYYYGTRDMSKDPSMSDKAVAERIAPVAKVAIDPNAPATPAPVQQVPIAAAPAAVPRGA